MAKNKDFLIYFSLGGSGKYLYMVRAKDFEEACVKLKVKFEKANNIKNFTIE